MRRKARLTTICVWIILLVIWFIVTNLKLISPILFPSPQDVWLTFTNILIHGYNNIPFWEHLGITLFRLFSALILVIITAVPLGLASGMFEWVHAVIDSVIQFYRPIPPLAYYTILIL